ncbi:MAG: tetratricopeptide repeat protein [Vicinamibacterales bacterium]
MADAVIGGILIASPRSRGGSVRAAVVLWLSFVAAAWPAAGQAPPDTLIMPFDNSTAEPRLFWLSEGSAVLASALVEEMGGRLITRDERLRAFERLQLPAAAALSHATMIKVGQLVGAGEVVVGAYDVVGTQLTVRARIIRLDTGRLLPEISESGPLSEMVTIYSRLVRSLRGDTTSGAPPTPVLSSPVAFEAYVKGLIAETPVTQVEYLEQALKLAPDDRVRLALASVLGEQERHQRALDVLSAVAPAGRHHRQARYTVALSLLGLTRFDEALDVLKALDADQRSAVVLNAMGVVQLRRGGAPPDARPTYYFSQASEVEPAEADYLFNLGYAYWQDRDPQAAIYWLREAVRRDPTDVDAHEVLASVLQHTGSTAEAARERELARRLSESGSSQGTADSRGEVPRGLERLRDRLERGGTRVDSVIAASGQRDSAALAAFHLDAGRRAFEREADREAEQALKRALFLSPYLADAHLLLGRLYLRGGRTADAIDTLKIALWSEETAAAHLVLAEAYFQIQEMTAAKAEVDRALALEPTSADAKKLQERIASKPPG